MIEEVSFPENNGSCKMSKTINNNDIQSTINIEYEFNALNNRHLFTIENEGFKVENVIGSSGCVLNIICLRVCKLFVILHSPLMDGMQGFQEELPAKNIILYIVDKQGLNDFLKLATNDK